jgi:ribosome modulation factor
MTPSRTPLAAFLLLLAIGISASRASAVPPQQGWDQPPAAYSDAARQGFQDGMTGAQRDADNHRTPDPNNRDEYRTPNLPRELWHEYREGFRRGYQTMVARLNGQQAPWQAVSPYQQQGYQDGMTGAQRDADNHRTPDPNNRDEYRTPSVPQQFWEDYRAGFRAGYQAQVAQIYGQSAPPPVYGRPIAQAPMARVPWDAPPPDFSEMERRGFQDGMIGARRDADNHRRPDPNNRDEYRSPGVPQQFWDEYREGFRRGYELAVGQMNGDYDPGRWQNAPGRYNNWQRQGFQDGMTGAQRDADNHRRPDPNNRDEYRSPHVPPEAWDAYREGFRRGYEVQMSRLYGGGSGR